MSSARTEPSAAVAWRCFLCVLVAGALAAVPAAARAAGPWGPPQLVSGDAGNPALAVNAAGEAIFAYVGRVQVMALSASADGVLGPAVAIGPSSVDGAWVRVPALAIGPAGQGAAVLEDPTGVRVVWKGPGGSFGQAQTFPGYRRPELRFDRYGNAGLTLVRDGPDGLLHISVAWRRPGDPSFRAPREVAVARDGDHATLLFSDSGALIVWRGRPVGGTGFRTHIYASFGSVEGHFSPPVIISNPSLDADRGVTGRLVADSNARGDVVIAWVSGPNGDSIDAATRRAGGRFVATRFPNTLARPAGGVSQSGTFLVGYANPFDPIAVHRDDGAPGGFRKVALPRALTPADPPVLGIDGLENLQILVAIGARYDHLGTHSVLADGTVGAFDEITVTRRKNDNPRGVLGFDAQGHGWVAFDDNGPGTPHLYVSRYDARQASAVRAPAISAVRYRRARPQSPVGTAAASRGPAVSLTLSKTSRVKLTASCLHPTRRSRCSSRKSSWKVRGQMGPNRIAVPRAVQRRLKRGLRHKLTLTARDSLGKLSRPKSIAFRR